MLLPLRFAMDHYVNLRPAKLYPVSRALLDVARVAPNGIDFVSSSARAPRARIVGNGGALRVDTPHEIATEVSVNTWYGVERSCAMPSPVPVARPRKHPDPCAQASTCSSTPGHLWRRTVEAVVRGSRTSRWSTSTSTPRRSSWRPTRAASTSSSPTTFFGDIITDIAAAIAGGIGLAASGNINPSGENPSMFEPVHGSALPTSPARASADPTAAILSVSDAARAP